MMKTKRRFEAFGASSLSVLGFLASWAFLAGACGAAHQEGSRPTEREAARPQAAPATLTNELAGSKSNAAKTAEAANTMVQPHACGAKHSRRVKAPKRMGSSIALVEEESGRRIVYVADEDNAAIHTLDADGPRELAVTLLPGKPAQLLPLQDGRLLVALNDKNNLIVLEQNPKPEDGLEIRCERPTYAQPWGLAISPKGDRIALSASWDQRVELLDSNTIDLKATLRVGAEPRALLWSEDGHTVYVSHLIGGVVSAFSPDRPEEKVQRIYVRPERPESPSPKKPKNAAADKAVNDTQTRAAAQGFTLAELSMGGENAHAWPARIFSPMASSDPMRFGAQNSFPGTYGGGGGVAVIGAFVAVIDPLSKMPLGRETISLRQARPEDCILPRGIDTLGDRMYLTCLGVDTLVELDMRSVDPITAQRRRFTVASGPTGVVVNEALNQALVWSQWAGAVTVVDLSETRKEAMILKLAAPEKPALTPQLSKGRELFYRTRDVRMSSDGRACASCHPDGRADGLTWATPDGPRQTISLAGRVLGSGPFGWFGDHPTAKQHVLFTISRLGGHGFQTQSDLNDFEALMAYAAALPISGRQGSLKENGIEELQKRGKELFFSKETGCSDCHVGGDGTDGKRHDVGSGSTLETRLSFDTPSLKWVSGSAPYFHDGRYSTLMELLSDPKSKMGSSAQLPELDRRALAAYLESL